MRINKEMMAEITGRSYPRLQAEWFRRYLGVEVPCDSQGPIVTMAAYEMMVVRACGLGQKPRPAEEIARPKVRLVERRV